MLKEYRVDKEVVEEEITKEEIDIYLLNMIKILIILLIK